jgi:hypothetical protein
MVLIDKAKTLEEVIFAHLEEHEVNGYLLKVFESDPYYHVEVSKDGVHVDDHLLTNRHEKLSALKEVYKKK